MSFFANLRRMNVRTLMLAGGAAAIMSIGGCEQTVSSDVTASTTPPEGAHYMEADVTPEALASWIVTHKGNDARREAAAEWANIWIPEPGWGGTVERVEERDSSTNVWLSYPANPLMGGNFWVAVEFPGMHELRPAQSATFTGRVEKVEYLTPSGVPELRIVVRNATLKRE